MLVARRVDSRLLVELELEADGPAGAIEKLEISVTVAGWGPMVIILMLAGYYHDDASPLRVSHGPR